MLAKSLSKAQARFGHGPILVCRAARYMRGVQRTAYRPARDSARVTARKNSSFRGLQMGQFDPIFWPNLPNRSNPRNGGCQFFRSETSRN